MKPKLGPFLGDLEQQLAEDGKLPKPERRHQRALKAARTRRERRA
ncbi:MAG: hypothetical protein ABSD48_18940 [Armatimonadota bacterium]